MTSITPIPPAGEPPVPGALEAERHRSADDARAAIRALWRSSETECVPPLIAAAQFDVQQRERIDALARLLVEGMRRHRGRGGIEALTRAFPLDAPAGFALLSLAEALLRVPDVVNADRLIRDRLGGIDWRAQGTAGLLPHALSLAAALVAREDHTAMRPLAGSLRWLSAPLVRCAAQLVLRALSGQFIYAQTIRGALARARRAAHLGYRFSFDMLGEAALTAHDAQRYFSAYETAIHAVGVANRGRGPVAGGGVSVKLSALHPRYGYTQQGAVMRELLPRLRVLARLARQYDIALAIDAEEADRLELSLDLIEALMSDAELSGWAGLGVAVQAYQKRAPAVIEYLLTLAARRRERLMVRLVKGAYWDAEIKAAQIDGLSGYPVYTRKLYTDVAYLACARALLGARAHVLPQFATHNAHTVAAIVELAGPPANPEDCEFQCLYGMGDALYQQVLGNAAVGRPVRVYAPVGARATLLAYLMRRLLENGAATSFVHRAFATKVGIETLCANPVAAAAPLLGAPHPRIALARDLFMPERRNSSGVDLADAGQRTRLLAAIDESRRRLIEVRPAIATDTDAPPVTTRREIRNPADRAELLGAAWDADETLIDAAIDAAEAGARAWADTEIEMRAQVLERAAELFEAQRPELVALAVREAGKSLANGVTEVREAVDSLRYYAAQIRAEFDRAAHLPLGPVVCISPWNFPLAIFTGQIAAALAAGNTVLAKPAEQTNAIAALAVRLLHEAGLPRTALQLLPGSGERVGARLVADPRVCGVVFTGSIAAARHISRALAARAQVPLIAETGGQNAMIVDSTALPEQVVADVLRSAFDSAGQRCSALRVLCLQQEIAEPILGMLEGAMRELVVGNPIDMAADVGPLIDEEARARVQAHLDVMRPRIRCQGQLRAECVHGTFVRPTLLEIGSIAELRGEVFGPVLHALRFNVRAIDALIDDINATGYGLTLGIASRIGSMIEHITERSRAGNVYVNRNMIGAVVGAQPFGGQGLSGTGPKAGGPLYLHRLLRQTPGPQWQLDQSARVPESLRRFVHWLREGDSTLCSGGARELLLQQSERYARGTLLGARMPLRGCVGERNELRLRARGVVRGTARCVPALLEQFAAALATGNVLVADQAELAATVREALPAALRRHLTRGARAAIALVDGTEAWLNPGWLHALRIELATLEGPIVPVVVSAKGYALERLLTEQTVTINTAAVGGDTGLLALDDGD